jgi:hypothetical protein
MTNTNTINLIKDMLDITLDFQLLHIENINNNLKEIEKYLPSLLTINKEYFYKFIRFITNSFRLKTRSNTNNAHSWRKNS